MPSSINDFEFLKRIGSGSFGECWLVRRKADKKNYVIKQINVLGMTPKEQQDALNEVNVLCKMNHENIIEYFDSFLSFDDRKLNIVMEYASHGNLYELIQKQKGKLLSEPEIWKYFIQILSALNHIHSMKVLHRDIKSMNIFLDSQNNAKIGDFGVSKVLDYTKQMAQTVIGTPFYLSPEMCENLPYDEKSDVWALGCVLYEMATLKHPFDAKNQGALVLKIITGQYPPLSSIYSSDLSSMIKSCLMKKPKQRPTTYQLLCHPVLVKKAKELGLNLSPLLTPSTPPIVPSNSSNNSPTVVASSSSNSNESRSSTPTSQKVIINSDAPEKKVVMIRPSNNRPASNNNAGSTTANRPNSAASVKNVVTPPSTHAVKRVGLKVDTKSHSPPPDRENADLVRNLPKIPLKPSASNQASSPIDNRADSSTSENVTPKSLLEEQQETCTNQNLQEDHHSNLTIKHEKSKERHINRILDKITQKENEMNEIKTLCKEKVSETILNQLITFFKDSVTNNEELSEEDINLFVFGKISFQQVDIIQHVYKIIYIQSAIDDLQHEIEECLCKQLNNA